MKIKLFQIAPEKDDNNLLFMNYEWAMSHGGIHQRAYKLVFEGDVAAKTLEDIFRIFNLEPPKGYRGRSMSVSDIVWAEGLGTFFCDSFGFKQLKKFNGNKCSWICRDINEKMDEFDYLCRGLYKSVKKLCKHMRGSITVEETAEEIAEEIANVAVMLVQAITTLDCLDLYEKFFHEKIDRTCRELNEKEGE